MISRRRFLAATAGGAGATVVAAACSTSGGTPAAPDHAAAATAAALERDAYDAYVTMRSLMTDGRLGAAEPPAIATFVVTAADQHHKAMERWVAILDPRHPHAVPDPDRRLRPMVDAALPRVADVLGVARLSLQLEDYLSRTYLRIIPTLQDPDRVMLAGRLAVVDQQRQAVLRYLLGLYPVGSGTVATRDPADFGLAPADPQAYLVTG